MIKVKGLKKAVIDFNSWRGHAVIKMSLEEQRVWTICYTDYNSSVVETEDDVFTLLEKTIYSLDDMRTSMKEVNALADILYDKKRLGFDNDEIRDFHYVAWDTVINSVKYPNVYR